MRWRSILFGIGMLGGSLVLIELLATALSQVATRQDATERQESRLPVEFDIDHQQRLVHARAHGPVVLKEVLDYFDAVTVQNAASYSKLFDARQMLPQLSDDDVMVLGARVSAYAAFDPRGAVAAVAATDEARDAVRRYMNFAGARRPMRLFDSIEEARAWLSGQRAA